jgi:hypothetical protein
MSDIVRLQVNALPAVPTLSASEICSGSKAVIDLSASVSGVSYSVFTVSTGGTAVSAEAGTGSALSITVDETLTAAKTYYVEAQNTSTTCKSARKSIAITVNVLPTAAGISGANAVCVDSKIALTNTTTGGKWTSNSANATVDGTTGEVTGVSSGSAKITYTVTNADNCSASVTKDITVHPKLTPGTTGSDDTICYNTTPAKLTSLSPASGGSGTTTYEWQYSIDNGITWTSIANSNSEEYSPPALTQTAQYRRMATNDCGTDSTAPVTITVRRPSLYNYPDLRVRVCPDAGTSINLSKYVDTSDLKTGYPQWKSLSGIPTGASDGIISANSLGSRGTYTFTYTVSNPCTTSDITRKVYLEVLNGGKTHHFRNTITICSDNADAVNINQIFGIDAGFDDNVWSYKSTTAGDVDKYVTISKSSTYYGAVVMNGKAIYDDTAIDMIPGTNNKKVVFTYTPKSGSCLSGKSYTITIILMRDES